jgi:hypothetical protein
MAMKRGKPLQDVGDGPAAISPARGGRRRGGIVGRLRQHLTLAAPFGALLTLDGCGSPGAPSLILFGAYFPAWILCAVAGVVAGVLARVAMVASGLSHALPLQLFVCIAVGLLVAVAGWLFWFGQ